MKKILSFVMAAALLLTALPFTAATAFAAASEEAKIGAEPEFETKDIIGKSQFESALKSDKNITLNINSDILEGGISDSIPVRGKKVIELNGHDISYTDNGVFFSQNTGLSKLHLLKVEKGAELVINDRTGGGKIRFSANHLWTNEIEYRHARNVIAVMNGGHLTVNSGTLEAGESEKFKIWSMPFSYSTEYRQVGGCAVIMDGGAVVVINGGCLRGRSSGYWNDAAITAASNCSLTIYDGEFWGMGCAPALRIDKAEKPDIRGGTFNVHKQDYEIVLKLYSSGGVEQAMQPEYGKIGIPARAIDTTRTQVHVTGQPNLSKEQIAAGVMTDTHNKTIVEPIPQQYGVVQKYNAQTNTYGKQTYGEVYEWDKETALRFQFQHSLYYPRYELHSYDDVDYTMTNHTTAHLRLSPEGEDEVTLNETGGASRVDLNNLTAYQKSLLEVGKTYYLRLTDYERWNSGHGEHRIDYADASGVKIKIVEPQYAMPQLNIGFDWVNVINSVNRNLLHITPSGDGSVKALTSLINGGKITNYKAEFKYADSSGVYATKTFRNDLSEFNLSDMSCGISDVTYTLTLYKNSKTLGSVSKKQDVVYFPSVTADRTADSSYRVLVEPAAANKTVTLSITGKSAAGMYWTRDGAKLSENRSRPTYAVDLSNANNVGRYSVGYTLNGKDYYSDQGLYLGIKDGTRTVSISTNASAYMISANSDNGPTLTATTSGSGWGTISEYKWQNVSWPTGMTVGAKRYSTTAKTVSVAEVLGCKNKSTAILAGTYVFAVTAYDNYGGQATSTNISVTIIRTAKGIKLFTDDYNLTYGSHKNLDVTNSFIVLDEANDKALTVYGKFTPDNAQGAGMTYESSDDSIVTVSSTGAVKPKKAGNAIITVESDSLSAQTTALVSKSKYEFNFPEEWLKAEVGGTVHRGSVTGNGFTAELQWEDSSGSTYTAETFAANESYTPTVIIRPNAGVCYPVKVGESQSSMWYKIDPSRYEITVNGKTYYGADARHADFYDKEPVSAGGSDDRIVRHLDSTGLLIDPRDEYLDSITFSVVEPNAGDPKDVNQSKIALLNYNIQTDGITCGGDSVMHKNGDKYEDFTTYESGETYRARVWLITDSKYKNSAGGKVYLTENAKATDPDHKTVSGEVYAPTMVIADVYFTVGEDEQPKFKIGDVNADGQVNGADAGLLSRYTSGWKGYDQKIKNMKAADVNQDGNVNGADAGILSRHVSGWTQYDKYFG